MDNVNKLLGNPLVPMALRILSLIAFIGLVLLGFTAHSEDAKFLKELRNTNLGNLIIWSYWWPLIVVTAILLGRFWCLICPVEMMTSLFSTIGLKLKRPSFVMSGWGITLFYIIILFIGIRGLQVHRDPTMMAWYLITIVIVSLATGLLYEKNTFCGYVCPVGHLLGLYAKFSFLAWRVKDGKICKNCKDKSCIQRKYTYNLVSKSCAVDLYPGKLDDNANCILCTGCLKVCKKYKPKNMRERPNPGLHHVGFASDLYRHKPLTTAESFFVLIVSGFVIYEILSEWGTSKKLLMAAPHAVKTALGLSNPILIGIQESLVLFLLLPSTIWLIPYIIARIAGEKLSIIEYMANYAAVFIPILAAGHLGKSILKATSRIPYLEYVFSDVSGMSTAQKILEKEILLRKMPEWGNGLITILISVIFVGGTYIAFKMVQIIGHKLSVEEKRAKIFYLIPILYGGVFFVTIFLWRWGGF